MEQDIKQILLTEQEITAICKRLGEQITKDYAGKELLVVGFLRGCVPFLAELIKYIKLPLEYDFMHLSSYNGTETTGTVKIKKDLSTDIKDIHVIIVEDIVDSGYTIQSVMPILAERKPASIEVVTLLDKPSGRKIENMNPKYVGHVVPNLFVVGFGLDYNSKYRNLPFVGVLKEEVYTR